MKVTTSSIGIILDSYKNHLEKTISSKRGMVAIKNLAPLYKYTEQTVAQHIDQWIASRNASPGTINRELSVLQAALRWSFKRGLIGFLPSLPRLPSPPPRTQFLTQVEIDRLLEASKQHPEVLLFVRVALMTGQRKEAILGLRWDQVNFDANFIDFNDPESPMSHRQKKRGVVPMSSALRELLLSLERSSPYVLHRNGKRIRDIRVKWAAVMKLSCLNITPHVLRHTVATQLAKKNVPITQISRLLGHSNTIITERVYAKFSPDFCKQAVEHLNA